MHCYWPSVCFLLPAQLNNILKERQNKIVGTGPQHKIQVGRLTIKGLHTWKATNWQLIESFYTLKYFTFIFNAYVSPENYLWKWWEASFSWIKYPRNMKIMEYLFNCSSLFKINLKWNFLVENCEVLVFSGYNMVSSFSIDQAEEFPIVSLWAGSFLKSEKFLCMLKHQRADAFS